MRATLLILNIVLLLVAMVAEFSAVSQTGDFTAAPLLWLFPSALTVLAIYYPGRALRVAGLSFNVLLGLAGLVAALVGVTGALNPGHTLDGWRLVLGVVFMAVAGVNFEATRTLGVPQGEETAGAQST